MQNKLMNLSSSSIVTKLAIADTLKCNDYTQKFGLVLSEEQAMNLVTARAKSLEANGRIEFGGGIVEKMIWTFCDSPYTYKSSLARPGFAGNKIIYVRIFHIIFKFAQIIIVSNQRYDLSSENKQHGKPLNFYK